MEKLLEGLVLGETLLDTINQALKKGFLKSNTTDKSPATKD
ncbi:MAG: hypothetical protein ACJAZX_000573 [Rickettsiales bacterium]|jgi:hypothetical protein